MSFVSTFNSLSIRGWENNEPVVEPVLQQDQIINSPVFANNAYFGRYLSLSSDGNTFVASGSTPTYVYNYNGTNFANVFSANVAIPAISGDGNTFIGASGGNVNIYTKSGNAWSLFQTLSNPPYVNFGNETTIDQSGNTLIAYDGNTSLGTPGGLITYIKSSGTYTEAQRITLLGPNNPLGQDRSLYISGDGNYIIVGCSTDNFTSADGYADIYSRSGNTFSYQTRLSASDVGPRNRFGQSVSLNYDGSIALIGAPYGGASAPAHIGTAYVFVRTGTSWTEQQKIISPTSTANDRFGTSSFISSDSSAAVIGAIYNDTGGLDRGAAFIYVNIGNSFYNTQQLNGAANSDFFGQGVAISNQTNWTTVVGAQEADISPRTNVGKVYIYSST